VAFGEQSCAGFEFTWQLSASSAWTTERLDMRLIGAGDGRGRRLNRTLLLERGVDGWRSQAWSNDRAAAPAPGLPAGDHAADAMDAVIDACPLSHWAPVRRLGLAGPRPSARRGGPTRPLAAGYPVLRVHLPSLAVVLTRQRYVWVEDAGSSRVLNHSFAGGPSESLSVDEQGVPVEFNGLSRRQDSAMVA
jgi:hypothetical protein